LNADKPKTEARENFDGQICETIAREICDDLKEIAEGPNGDYREVEEASAETYGQSPIEKARANYHRWRGIATDAMRQYRYACAALGRELRAEEDYRKQQAADAEPGQT